MNDHELLARIDERCHAMQVDICEIKTHGTKRANFIEGKVDKHTDGHWWRVALISGTVIAGAIGVLVAYIKLAGAG